MKPYECTYLAGENLEERKSEGQKGGWNRKKESIDSSVRNEKRQQALCPSIKETQQQYGLCELHISDSMKNGSGNSSAKNLREF